MVATVITKILIVWTFDSRMRETGKSLQKNPDGTDV